VRIYAYVDGESHYERSLHSWKELQGKQAELSHIEARGGPSGRIMVEPGSKFFWDSQYQHISPFPFNGQPLQRKTYFTAYSGDADGYHQACVGLRKYGFDPRIVQEVKNLSDRRSEKVLNCALLEKAKGVDIGLSVSILEDAYHNNFDACYLFTSDIDFLPVVEAIRRFGKHVIVFGYGNGIGNRSKLEYVPDFFIDLRDVMKTQYQYGGPRRVEKASN
jgi:uncharacterized LabA/DUF88 family protein